VQLYPYYLSQVGMMVWMFRELGLWLRRWRDESLFNVIDLHTYIVEMGTCDLQPIIELDSSSLWLWRMWSHQLVVVIVGEDFSSKSCNIKSSTMDLFRNHIYWNFGQNVPNKLVTKPFFKIFFLSYFFGKSHHVDIDVSILVKVTSLIWLWTCVIMCHIWLQMLP
jgi:hypothetical protein